MAEEKSLKWEKKKSLVAACQGRYNLNLSPCLFIFSPSLSRYLWTLWCDRCKKWHNWAQTHNLSIEPRGKKKSGWELKGGESDKSTVRQQRHAGLWVYYTPRCCWNKSLMEHHHTLATRVWADLTAWESSTLSADSHALPCCLNLWHTVHTVTRVQAGSMDVYTQLISVTNIKG